MKCFACGYIDDYEPGTRGFDRFAEPYRGGVIVGRICDRSWDIEIFICPECGTLKIETAEDCSYREEKNKKFREKEGVISFISFGVSPVSGALILKIAVNFNDDSGFTESFIVEDAVKIIQETGVEDINDLVGMLCICDVEDIADNPACKFKRLKRR